MNLSSLCARRSKPIYFKPSMLIVTAFAVVLVTFGNASAQAESAGSVSIVQPGAPGQATKKLPSTTRGQLAPMSAKDVEFMQGMIHHHAQAVEMTAMIDARTENRDIRLLGTRISRSQEDEMAFMRRWLENRGQPTEMQMSGHAHHGSHQMLMPGMLTPQQMKELEAAKGSEFDRLFLAGMIQHHIGALDMVKDLFDSAGSGQDAELFNFASDVDSGQRAEIKTMEVLLERSRNSK